MTKWQTRLRCTAGLAGGRGELALGHGELFEVGADRRLVLPGEQGAGDVLVFAELHGELGFPDDRQGWHSEPGGKAVFAILAGKAGA